LLCFLFFILIGSIIKIAWQGFSKGEDSLIIGLCSGLLMAILAILILAIPGAAFRIVTIPEVYWSFVAITFATLRITQYKHAVQTHRASKR